MREFIAACVQIAVTPNDVQANVDKGIAWLEKAVREYEAELVLFPETVTTTFVTGLQREELWDLVDDHQTRCSYEKVQSLIESLDEGKNREALEGILAILQYDTQIRLLAVQKGGLDPEMTDFLLGRPITETIRMYGLKVEKEADTYRLIPINNKDLTDS